MEYQRPSKEDLADDIRRVAEKHGDAVTMLEYDMDGKYSRYSIQKHFDSWNAAKAELGLEPNTQTNPHPFLCYECYRGFDHYSSRGSVECPHCGSEIVRWRAAMARARNNSAMRELANGPIRVEYIPIHVREMVQQLSLPSNHAYRGKIYYLDGDLRRAVDLYIELNEDYVRDGLEDGSLAQAVPKDIYMMIVEQWELKWKEVP